MVFRAVDAYGNQRRYASGEVRLHVTGPAELIGDNPFAFGEYGGLGAVWLRSLPGRSGPVTVIAEHPELGRARVMISVATAGREPRLTGRSGPGFQASERAMPGVCPARRLTGGRQKSSPNAVRAAGSAGSGAREMPGDAGSRRGMPSCGMLPEAGGNSHDGN